MKALGLAAASVMFLTVAPARASEPWRPLSAIAPTPGSGDEGDAQKKDDLRKRNSLKTLHRAFGITTWISLAATNVIGTMRYANVIGFGDPLCEDGSPILGRSWGCGDGLKYQHLISASFTTASYITTRTIAGLMPDPYDAAETNSRLKWHRRLSWVHLVGMIAMPVLGLATSATEDEGARRTLATVHLVTGYTTFAAVSTAAALMVF